jgi:hypothetical protein
MLVFVLVVAKRRLWQVVGMSGCRRFVVEEEVMVMKKAGWRNLRHEAVVVVRRTVAERWRKEDVIGGMMRRRRRNELYTFNKVRIKKLQNEEPDCVGGVWSNKR